MRFDLYPQIASVDGTERIMVAKAGVTQTATLQDLNAFCNAAAAVKVKADAVAAIASVAYSFAYPTVSFTDNMQGAATVTSTSPSKVQYTAVAGYIQAQVAASIAGNAYNCVALFGYATAEVDGASVWGINTLLQDSTTRAVGTGTGRILTGELDYNVMNTTTQVNGLSIGGNSLAQPTQANGFTVNPLGTPAGGASAYIKWSASFISNDAATNTAVSVGATATSGIDISSQKISVGYFDHTGTKQQALFQVSSFGAGAAGTYTIGGTNYIHVNVAYGNVTVPNGTISEGGTLLSAKYAALAGATFTGTAQAPSWTVPAASTGFGYASAQTSGYPFVHQAGGANRFIVDASGNVTASGAVAAATVKASAGLGVWGTTPPATQPARAVTLADVIVALAGAGLTA